MNEGNNVVPMAQQQLPAVPEAGPYDFMPRTLAEAMELSRMLAESTMVPKDYLGKPGNCFIAMQHGAELGLKPVQSLQSIAVINGKPGIYGDAGKALLLRHGCKIIELDMKDVEARGYAQCTVGRPGHEPVTRTFSKADAVRAKLWDKDGPWRQYPYRQMAWRAFWFAARDAAADILKGLPPAEELRDMGEIDITPQGETLPSAPAAVAPTAESATSKLKERLAPSLAVTTLVKEIEAAESSEQLTAIVAKGTALQDVSAADRGRLNAAYKVAKNRILDRQQESGLDMKEKNAAVAETATATTTNSVTEKNSAPDPLTDEQIIAGVTDAKTREEAALFASLHIQPLPTGPRRDTLETIYRNRVEGMEP